MAHIVALSTLLLVSVTCAEAASQKYVQHDVLRMAESVYPDTTWQETIEKLLTRSRERCGPTPTDLVVQIEEVVPEENVETGIPRREAVRAFVASRTGAQGLVVVGTLTVKKSNARRVLRGDPTPAKEHEVYIQSECSPR